MSSHTSLDDPAADTLPGSLEQPSDTEPAPAPPKVSKSKAKRQKAMGSPMAGPEEHAKALGHVKTRVHPRAMTIYSWQHKAAAALHRWNHHAHHAGEPKQMTLAVYEAALDAAAHGLEPVLAAMSDY